MSYTLIFQYGISIMGNQTISDPGSCFVDETFFSFHSPNGVIKISGFSSTKLLVSTSTFLNCTNTNPNSNNAGCVTLVNGQCISYRVCSTKSSSKYEGSYCSATVSDSSSKNYLFHSSIHSGSSSYNSFCFRNGDKLVSSVNDTNNIAERNSAFYVDSGQNCYINYSYFKGNKATSSEFIFCYYSIPTSETYSCVFLNNSNVNSGDGIFRFSDSGTYLLRECIIKYNEHTNLISSSHSRISISFIKCLIDENNCSVTHSGSAQPQIETTNSLSIKLSLYSTEECIKEIIFDNYDCEVRYAMCIAEKNALEFKVDMRPSLYYILTVDCLI